MGYSHTMEYDSDSERDADTNNIVDECSDIILST